MNMHLPIDVCVIVPLTELHVLAYPYTFCCDINVYCLPTNYGLHVLLCFVCVSLSISELHEHMIFVVVRVVYKQIILIKLYLCTKFQVSILVTEYVSNVWAEVVFMVFKKVRCLQNI